MKVLQNQYILIFIILCVILFITCVPHYDDERNIVLFGQFYSLEDVSQYHDVIEDYEDKINHLETELQHVTKSNKFSTFNNSQLEKTVQQLTSEIDQLKQSNQVLQYKIQQQHEYYEKKDKEEVKVKKEDFSRVSKKVINTSRPEIGNMYSKSIKKKSNYKN